MMEPHDSEAIYAEAQALLARYRAAGVTPDLAALGQAPRRTSGTKAQRAEQRLARHRRNALSHREAQAQRDEECPPTRKQRQLLWCLGYRGPAPQNRAEVAALVAELRDGPYALPLRVKVAIAESVKESAA